MTDEPFAFEGKTFSVKCRGRDEDDKEVLEKAVDAEVKIRKSPLSHIIDSTVKCQYISNGTRCIAPEGKRGVCAYIVTLGE